MEEESSLWKLQSDWYSPTRLHNSPIACDFPGDRFIPNRSLMDLDQAHGLLTNRTTDSGIPKFSENYRKKLQENMTLDIEGRPFRMLVFRGSPRASRRKCRLIDELRRSDESISYHNKQQRHFPKKESRTLDAPNLRNDFYSNLMDWGKNNVLAVALGSKVYTYNMFNREIRELYMVESEDQHPISVSWSEDGKMLAVGHTSSEIQLWDPEASKLVRSLEGHKARVGTLAWNSRTLTSGSYDRAIINHDVRASNSLTSKVRLHKKEVCGLKWSETGDILASGGNDNKVFIWNAAKMCSSIQHYMQKFSEHTAAVKALDWCPYNYDVVASGGGANDGCIKVWNVQTGICVKSINTKSQVCSLLWNRHHKEILSGHGFGFDRRNEFAQQLLCLWKYPSMSKIGGSTHLTSRVLHLSQSPDGLTVVSAGGDETISVWEIFGPPQEPNSLTSSSLDSLLSLKTSPIR